MFNINDIVMIKQNKYMTNNHVGYTGIITCISNRIIRTYLVTFKNNETELYCSDDLVNVSTYKHNEVN